MQKYVKNLNEFLSENLNKSEIGDVPLNESFKSGILSSLAKNKDLLQKIQALSKKGSVLFNITDEMITRVQGKEAWKYKTDNFIKFWYQGDKFAMTTVGNKRVGHWLDPTRSQWARSGAREYQNWTGKQLKDLSHALVIDLNQMPKKNALKAARTAAKAGATSLISNADIKKANLERYRKTLAEHQFSDGTELDLIVNATKYVQTLVDTLPALSVITNPPSDSFYYSYIKDYAKKLLEYIVAIEEVSYDIEKVIKNDWGRAISIKGDLKKILQSVKDYNSRYLNSDNNGAKFCKLMTSEGFYADFKTWLIENSGPDMTKFLDGIEELNDWCNKNVTNIISSLKFTSIIELEMFADIMHNIGRDYSDLSRALNTLNFIYDRWVDAGRKEATFTEVFGEDASENAAEREIGNWGGIEKMINQADILKRKINALKKITTTS